MSDIYKSRVIGKMFDDHKRPGDSDAQSMRSLQINANFPKIDFCAFILKLLHVFVFIFFK